MLILIINNIYIYIYVSCPHFLGAKYCTPEINTPETIVDVQWHFPMDVQWHFPTNCHISAVCSKGLSLVQWIVTGIVQWIFSSIFQWMFMFVRSGV